MKTSEIIDRLRKYEVPEEFLIELCMHYSIPGSIAICCTIARMINEYNSDELIEKQVEELLQMLLKRHFMNFKIDRSLPKIEP